MVKRDPDATRQRILDAGFAEIYRCGFQKASVDQILADTGLTKGAFYHHFTTKADLGYAVLDEVIGTRVLERWVAPMERSQNPIDGLLDAFSQTTPEELEQICACGCPLNNLAQEMSSVDETFRRKIAQVYQHWKDRMANALMRGQTAGLIDPQLDCADVAAFIIATLEGSAGAVKNARDPAMLQACMNGISRYLESLRSPVLVTAS